MGKKESICSILPLSLSLSPLSAEAIPPPAPVLPSPFDSLVIPLFDPDLRDTAYDTSECQTSVGSHLLTHNTQSERSTSGSRFLFSASSASALSNLPFLQRSLTLAAACKMKKALVLKSMSDKGTGIRLPSRKRLPVSLGAHRYSDADDSYQSFHTSGKTEIMIGYICTLVSEYNRS